MTALIVIGAIALLIFILLASSVTVDVEYERVFKYRVRYLFFTLIGDPESPRRIKKKRKKERNKKSAQSKQQPDKKQENDQASAARQESTEPAKQDTEKPQEKAQSEPQAQAKPADKAAPKKPKQKISLDQIKRIWDKASPHVKRIFKKIRFSNVVIDITTGGDDAAKTAISYGVHCSAVYGLITFLDSVISFKADRISVMADFGLPKTEYYLKGTVKLRLSTLLHSGIWGFFAVFAELRKVSGAPPEKNAVSAKKAA